MELTSADLRIVLVRGGALIAGERVVLANRHASLPSLGILTSYPGEAVETSVAVRVIPIDQMRPGLVAVGDDLASSLDLLDGPVPWRLRMAGFETRHADEIELEMTLEQPLEDAVAEVGRCSELAERPILIPAGADVASVSVSVGGKPYSLRRILPAPGPTDTVFEMSAQTRVSVHAAGVKSAVDIVILADCSGSMSVDDLTAPSAMASGPAGFLGGILDMFRPARSMSRMQALHRALGDLLDRRLRVSGRMSRMALVGFTTSCRLRYPVEGGMAEIDDGSPAEAVQEFRDAMSLLKSVNEGTDIGQAIHYAAELLHRYGKPGNDRLIVLISDGAHWAPKSEKATGEVVHGVEEPVSLMEHLHREMKVNLHAIGISNEKLFSAWARRKGASAQRAQGFVPNHALLEELVKVGGGDPSQTGDAEVVERYFRGLGLGVTRRSRTPSRRPLPGLQPHEVEAVSRQAAAARDAEVDRLCDGLHARLLDAAQFAARKGVPAVFRPSLTALRGLLATLRRPATTDGEFLAFVIGAHKAMIETLDPTLRDVVREDDRRPHVSNYPVQAVVQVIRDGKLKRINKLRNAFAHEGDRRGDHAAHERRLGLLFRDMVGVEHILPDDAEGWAKLQRAVLSDLAAVATDVLDSLRQDSSPAPVNELGFVFRE